MYCTLQAELEPSLGTHLIRTNFKTWSASVQNLQVKAPRLNLCNNEQLTVSYSYCIWIKQLRMKKKMVPEIADGIYAYKTNKICGSILLKL